MTNELGFDTKFATQIGESQVWEGKEILFDPDSSPASWEHYKICYKDTFKDIYNIQSPQFFSYFKGKYVDIPLEYYNRLYALNVGAKRKKEKWYSIYQAESRVSGETDFNFNEYKYGKFLNILFNELKNNKEEFEKQKAELDKCSKMHHTLLNFSLMQTMGGMQQVKSRGLGDRFDRPDTLIYLLDCYYRKDEKNKDKFFSGRASAANKQALRDYLDSFTDVYDYCKKIYFIDEDLVKKLINNGSKPINTVEDISKYMDLALEFWKQKEEKLRSLYSKALKK